MRTIEGDLIGLAKAGHFDVIVHGCNCHNTMGRGSPQRSVLNSPKPARPISER